MIDGRGHGYRATDRDLLELTLFRLDEVKRNLAVLNDFDTREWERRHVEATWDILHNLRRTCQFAIDWTEQRGWPTFAPFGLGGIRLDVDIGLINHVGERLHYPLRANGLTWPPPYSEPPPAVTRDLLAVYELAIEHQLRGGRDVDEFRFLSALRRVADISSELLHEMNATGVLGTRAVERARRVVGSHGERGENRLTSILAAVALAITLLQGPGALHDFPRDVADLGSGMYDLSRMAVIGVAAAAEEIEYAANTGRG